MPKVEIDYSTTIIYKITCNDPNVKDVYVGHTTNFVQRKHAHKQSCINEKASNNKCKLYEVIRNNGGWVNWSMEIIHFCNCKNHYEARIKEQEYFVLLNANLNSIEPMPPTKPTLVNSQLTHSGNTSGVQPLTSNNNDSIQIELTYDVSANNAQKNGKYICDLCEYTTSNKYDYNRHTMTPKHTINTSHNKKNIKIQNYICLCGNEYKYQSGLCAHKKKCQINNQTTTTDENVNDEDDELPNNSHLIIEILKHNQEFKELILEKLSSNNHESLILEILKQNQEFKELMIEQNKYMMEQSKQMMDIAKKCSMALK